MKHLKIVCLLTLLGTLAACGGETVQRGDNPELTVEPSDSVVFPRTSLGTTTTEVLKIQNTGSDTLKIRSLELKESDGDGRREFRPGDKWFETATIPPQTARTISVDYVPQNQTVGAGHIIVRSNGTQSSGTTKVSLEAPQLKPQLVAPGNISFGRVPPAQPAWRLVELKNSGEVPLEIDDIVLDHDNFRLTYPDPEASEQTPETDLGQLPISALEPQESMNVRVWFEPDETNPVNAQMFIFSNDNNKSQLPETVTRPALKSVSETGLNSAGVRLVSQTKRPARSRTARSQKH